MTIPVGSIGKVIGPGGKSIRALIAEFSLSDLDISKEGVVGIGGFDQKRLVACKEKIEGMVAGGGGGQGGRATYSGMHKNDTYTRVQTVTFASCVTWVEIFETRE
jgi:polyribonucleotide nucleotidyltransferase